MKSGIHRSVTVVKEFQFDISLTEEQCTPEALTEFEQYMFPLDGDTHEERLNSLFEYVAEMDINSVSSFVEGVGEVVTFCKDSCTLEAEVEEI